MMETIDIYKGDNLVLPFALTSMDANGVETVLDITGFTCFFTAKKNALDVDADNIISKRWTNHSSPTTGETELILLPADTAIISSLTFDFGFVDGTGSKTTLLVGKLNIKQNVTITV